MILPPAVTYARKKWVKGSSGLYLTDIQRAYTLLREDGFYTAIYGYSMFISFEAWNQLMGEIKWQPNMGDTMRGKIVK